MWGVEKQKPTINNVFLVLTEDRDLRALRWCSHWHLCDALVLCDASSEKCEVWGVKKAVRSVKVSLCVKASLNCVVWGVKSAVRSVECEV